MSHAGNLVKQKRACGCIKLLKDTAKGPDCFANNERPLQHTNHEVCRDGFRAQLESLVNFPDA